MTASQSLALPFAEHRTRFIEQWERAGEHLLTEKEKVTGDGGRLYRISPGLILAHEDKVYDGAIIASLSIPWGEYSGDDAPGGYHLVWTRDMCQFGASWRCCPCWDVASRGTMPDG
jgi:glucoamylase